LTHAKIDEAQFDWAAATSQALPCATWSSTAVIALQRRTLSVAIMVAVSSTMVTGRCRWSLNVFITRSASCAPVKSDRINAYVRYCTRCAHPRQVQVISVRLHDPIRLLQRPQEAPVRANTSHVSRTLMPLLPVALLLPLQLRPLLLVRTQLLPTLSACCGGASFQASGRARLDPAFSCWRVTVPRFCVRILHFDSFLRASHAQQYVLAKEHAHLVAQQAVVDEDAVQAVAQHLVHQRRRHCGVDASAQRADHVLLVAHLHCREAKTSRMMSRVPE